MDKVVKGATKIKLAAPKSKYVEAILSATNGGEAGVAEVFRTLQIRLRDSTWTIVFKALIIVHLMIREGQTDVTLSYIAESPRRLAISSFTEVQTQGSNIRRYSEYLLERVRGYNDTKADAVRVGAGRLKNLTVEKGLLRETESVQNQIRALVKCDLLGTHDPDNEITLTAFRLLTMDLLELFKTMNEGTINVLEHYFEMSRPDAERALNIYKTFARQTEQVVQYLAIARQYEMSTRLEVPKLKHAPTTLTSSLEEYLNDPDFEVSRRQYLAQQEAKRSGKALPPMSTQNSSRPAEKVSKPDTSFPMASVNKAPVTSQPQRGPPADLIDFFDSIDSNQQPMAQQSTAPQQFNGNFQQPQQYQQTQFQPQQTGYNPFMQQQAAPSFPQQQQQQVQPLQTDFTGAGFGGYTLQQNGQRQAQGFQSPLSSIPQNGMAEFDQQPQPQQLQPQQTSTNPFRQSMMQTGPLTSSFSPTMPNPNRQSTNPFAKNTPVQPQQLVSQPFSPTEFPQAGSQMQSQQHDFQSPNAYTNTMMTSPISPVSPIQPQQTGTNPFAKNRSPPPPAGTLVANPTGSTNPFRQSTFVNPQTGQGWQRTNQGIFDAVETIPVFPRPGQS